MEFHFKVDRNIPGPKARLCIQERLYKTFEDRRRAMTQLEKYWTPRVGFCNIFTLGTVDDKPRLYICRKYTNEEIERAGFTREDLGYVKEDR
jgi:hypothetical protein